MANSLLTGIIIAGVVIGGGVPTGRVLALEDVFPRRHRLAHASCETLRTTLGFLHLYRW